MFQADDIKVKALTPYVITSSREGENFIHFTYEIHMYGIETLLKKEQKKNAMTPQEISKQIMRESKLKKIGGLSDGMDLRCNLD